MATDERREIEELEAALKATLSPSEWERVRRLVNLNREEVYEKAGETDVERVEEMARHFPMMAPAIRVVGQHLFKQRLGDVGRCCESSFPLLRAVSPN